MFPLSQWRQIASLLFKPLLHATCRRGLTIRSTGPIAAGRHLGYKSLAQMSARHNGPVSSNVRPQELSPEHRMIYYRPIAIHRKNVRGVLMPLTAAIFRVFGNRAQDNGRPIGAFYPSNISTGAWDRIGGIWYKAKDENKVRDRSVSLHTVDVFVRCILSGQSCVLPNGTEITWERIPGDQAIQLPPPIVLSSPG